MPKKAAAKTKTTKKQAPMPVGGLGLVAPPPEQDRASEIRVLMDRINKNFKGQAVMRTGADIQNVFILRRPTGITTLDLALGGGFPAGGLTQIIGRYSAGKSYLSNRVMATAQETYGDQFAAAVCMTEMPYDKAFAKEKCGLRVGFNDEEIEVFQRILADKGLPPYSDEQIAWLKDEIGIFTETKASTAEVILEAAVQQIESNLFQVVLIDSFGALLTAAEAEADEGLNQKHRGGAAMVITQFMHRLHAALNLPDQYGLPNKTTVLGINQYRDNVNAGMYGNPMKEAGGHAFKHGQLVSLHLEQGKKIWQKYGNENVMVGKEINWEISKGKAGCHDGHRGTYKFYMGERGYGFGIDAYSDLLVAGLQTEVVDQAGSWYSFQGERLGQGESNVAMTLHQNPDILQRIRKEIFKVAGLNFITKENV